jgi:hypothetical protein
MLRFGVNFVRHCNGMRRHDEFSRTGQDLLDALRAALERFAATQSEEKWKTLDPASPTLAIIDLDPNTLLHKIEMSLEKSDLTVVSIVIRNGTTGESFSFSLSRFEVMQRVIRNDNGGDPTPLGEV